MDTTKDILLIFLSNNIRHYKFDICSGAINKVETLFFKRMICSFATFYTPLILCIATAREGDSLRDRKFPPMRESLDTIIARRTYRHTHPPLYTHTHTITPTLTHVCLCAQYVI